jgi:beta-lactamase superfamily II metal-dependent hydrolase
MEIRIFDVGHGFCAYVVADNGNVMLFDAGHNTETGFKPSSWLLSNRCTGIEHLVITNYDQDHVSDLHNIYQNPLLPIRVLYRNRAIDPEQLRRMKEAVGPIYAGMDALLRMSSDYTASVTTAPELPNIEFATFCNPYPEFADTNNLSLVSFIHYGDLNMVLPGDLEKGGWRKLLNNVSFCRHLSRVNFFVASHHGRISGYCEEVFDLCKPDLVIISDEYVHYDTQETNYRKHAKGIPWDNGTRYVLTTRKDGRILITHRLGANIRVETSK